MKKGVVQFIPIEKNRLTNYIIFTDIYYVTRKIFAHAWNPTLTTSKSIMLNFPTHFNTLKICFSYKAKEKSTEKLSSSLLASISQYRGRGRLTAKLLYICFGACVYKYVKMCVRYITILYTFTYKFSNLGV